MRQRNFKADLGYKLAVLACVSSPVAMHYVRHFADIDRAYIGRALAVILLSFATSPFRLFERIWLAKDVGTTPLREHPIFILGHWRSGTTHLHNLMCQDQNLGYVSAFQAFAPDLFLTGQRTLLPLLLRLIPPTKRPEDNVTVALDGPQEEEIAMAKVLPYSCLHLLILPRNARCLVRKYCLMNDLPKAESLRWTAKYMEILRKASWQMGNKRLILKNPANTGRIKTLLSLFPNAKFIHIHRNPYTVFLSSLHYYKTLLPLLQIQKISQCELEEHILLIYKQILKRYLRDKRLIPPGNLVETRFENLEANPLEEIHYIYQALGLPGFSCAEGAFRAYISSLTHYQKNKYIITNDVICNVNKHWRFAFDAWDYDLINPSRRKIEDETALVDDRAELISA